MCGSVNLRFEAHHLWFIPSTVYLLSTQKPSKLVPQYRLSAIWLIVLCTATWHIVPRPCVYAKINGRTVCMRMNVNMIQHWWGVEHLSFFHSFDVNAEQECPFFAYWAFALGIYNVLNTGLFMAMMVVTTTGYRCLSHLYGRGKLKDSESATSKKRN